MTDIVADIGGTNARFALVRQGQISAPVSCYARISLA